MNKDVKKNETTDPIKTNKTYKQKQTKTNKNKQKQTKTNKNIQKQTKTNKKTKQTHKKVVCKPPYVCFLSFFTVFFLQACKFYVYFES